jgi:Flp pilus assembly protein TadG
MNRKETCWRRRIQATEGAATIEAALIMGLLLMLFLGILEFGLLFSAKYAMTNAAREGARYGVIYKTRADGTRLPPIALSPSIQQAVTSYLTNLLPPDSFQVQVVNNLGYQTGQAGTDLTVIVTYQNVWDFLGGFIPQMQNITLSSQHTMKCE